MEGGMTNDEMETEDVTRRIVDLLGTFNLQPIFALVALADAMHTVIASVQCTGCRQMISEDLSKMVPTMIDSAMRAPGEEGAHPIH
jgi:hypothetical protein